MAVNKKRLATSVQEQLAQKPGEFEWERQAELDEMTNAWINRDKFEYDMGADPMYQKYKEQYAALGKMAMEDTVGQVSSLTGGYANSYAQTAGQQSYQNYMDQLNSMMPEFYGMARSNYDAEGQQLYNEIAMLEGQRAQAYNEYQADVNDWYNYLSFLQQEEARRSSGGGGGGSNSALSGLPSEAKQRLSGMADEERATYLNGLAESGVIDADIIPGVMAIYNGYTESNAPSEAVDTSKVPESVRTKLWGAKTTEEWDGLIETYIAGNVITRDQAMALTAERSAEGDLPGSVDDVPYKERTWTVANGGGTDWFWGINLNAEFTDGVNTYTTVELRKKLMESGMSRKEATDFITDLEKKYGIG
jgi:hypothetical protein